MTFNPLLLGAIQTSGAGGFTYSQTGATTANDRTYSQSGNTYRAITWTSSGSLTVSEAVVVDYLVMSGGGGGAGGAGGGGGGAGGMYSATSLLLSAGTHTITIGAGGAGASQSGVHGGSNGSGNS